MTGTPHPPALGAEARSAAGGLQEFWLGPQGQLSLGVALGHLPQLLFLPGVPESTAGPGPTQPRHWHLQQPRDQGPRRPSRGHRGLGEGGLATVLTIAGRVEIFLLILPYFVKTVELGLELFL